MQDDSIRERVVTKEEKLKSNVEIVLKFFQMLIIPIILLFYAEVRTMTNSINELKTSIVQLVPLRQFTDLDKRVLVLETAPVKAEVVKLRSEVDWIKVNLYKNGVKIRP